MLDAFVQIHEEWWRLWRVTIAAPPPPPGATATPGAKRTVDNGTRNGMGNATGDATGNGTAQAATATLFTT